MAKARITELEARLAAATKNASTPAEQVALEAIRATAKALAAEAAERAAAKLAE